MAKKTIVIENVSITGTADKGKGVGRTAEGLVLFVDGTVPGDVVDVFVQKKKPEFAEGLVHAFITKSPLRVEPFCSHFSICGGCKWQNLAYESQLEHKSKVVLDAFRRISKVEVEEFLPIMGAPTTTYYRNKLEYAFANRRWLTREEMDAGMTNEADVLGFHKANAFDKMIDIDHCYLQADPSNKIRNTLRAIGKAQHLEFYDLRRQKGFLRHIMIRKTDIGEVMLIISFAQGDQERIDA